MLENEEGSDIGKSARKGIAWTGLAQVMSQGLDFFVGILMARLLTPSDFGVVSACMIFFSFISIFTSFGFSSAIVQRQSLEQDYVKTAQTLSFAVGMFSTVFMLISAPLIGRFYGNPDVGEVVPVMSLMFVISSFNIVPNALLTRKFAFRKVTLTSMIGSCVYGITAVAMAYSGLGVWSLVMGPIASMLTGTVLLSIAASYFPSFGFRVVYFKELIRFGGLVTASSLLNHVARNADNLIIGRYLGSELLGLYARAYNLATLPKEILVSVFGSVLFPSFSRMQSDHDRLQAAYLKSVNAISLIALPAGVFFFLTSPELVRTVYGLKWSGAIVPLRILSLSGFLYALYIPCTSLLLGLGLTKLYTKLQIMYSGVIVLFVAISFKFGINMVAGAVFLAIAACYFAYIFTVHRIIGLNTKKYVKNMTVSIKATTVMASCIAAVKMSYLFENSSTLLFFSEIMIGVLSYLIYLSVSNDDIVNELKLLLRSKF